MSYFVYWSTERPFDDHVDGVSLFSALVIDAVYSHFLYFLPGVKDILYGPADIEGATVVFEVLPGARYEVLGGVADDASHDLVQLSARDLRLDEERVVLMTDVWSHQLGARGAADFARRHPDQVRCYVGAALRPLTVQTAGAFRLGSEGAPRRAKPAWRWSEARRIAQVREDGDGALKANREQARL